MMSGRDQAAGRERWIEKLSGGERLKQLECNVVSLIIYSRLRQPGQGAAREPELDLNTPNGYWNTHTYTQGVCFLEFVMDF